MKPLPKIELPVIQMASTEYAIKITGPEIELHTIRTGGGDVRLITCDSHHDALFFAGLIYHALSNPQGYKNIKELIKSV
jgi:hypothetical protein